MQIPEFKHGLFDVGQGIPSCIPTSDIHISSIEVFSEHFGSLFITGSTSPSTITRCIAPLNPLDAPVNRCTSDQDLEIYSQINKQARCR